MQLKFEGPLSWPGLDGAPSIFESNLGRGSGVYLWTVPQGSLELIYYVGETGRTFATRMQEHYKEHAAGFYHLNEPDALMKGERKLVWPGLWHAGKRATPTACVQQLLRLAPVIDRLNWTYRFYVASVDCPARIRKRIEGAIARELVEEPPPVGTFQEQGIRYHARKPDEEPLICQVINPDNFKGLPCELVA